MKLTSYWLDTAPKGAPERSRTTVGGRTEVAVIGGGLTGVVAALHLARRGAKVDLFEQDTVGFGASGRNGGMATTGMSIGIRAAVDKLGFDTARRLYDAYSDAIDLVEKLVADEGIDCHFARTGKLNLASKPSHYEGYAEDARAADDPPRTRSAAGPCGRAPTARSGRTRSTAAWSSRRARASTSASTSAVSARQPSGPASRSTSRLRCSG